MKLLRTSWMFGRWCAGCLRDSFLVLLWFVLAAILLVQISIVTSHQLPMPEWLLRKIEARASAGGVRLKIGEATMDPAGHVLVRHVRVTPESFDDAIAVIESVYIRLDPLALLHGHIKPLYLHVSGLDLQLPAMFSPTGRTEPVIKDVRFSARHSGEALGIDDISGRLGDLTFAASGAITLPDNFEQRDTAPAVDLRPLFSRYIDVARQILENAGKLSAFERPHLSVNFASQDKKLLVRAAFTARRASIDLSATNPELGRIEADQLRATTYFTTDGSSLPAQWELQAHSALVGTSTGYHLDDANVRVRISREGAALRPQNLALSAGLAEGHGHRLEQPVLTIAAAEPDRYAVSLSARTWGTAWQLDADLAPARGNGHAEVVGALTPALVAELALLTKRPPERLLVLRDPAPFEASLDFADGWKCAGARGWIKMGQVVASTVPFDSIEGDYVFDGTELTFYNLVAHQGENLARGIYWMNTKTLDFRFLLAGFLRPLHISDFFESWWQRFWGNFDFTPAPAKADVAVYGRWGLPLSCTVFVNVDASRPTVRGVFLDHINTTLFIRPDFYDALEVRLSRDGHSARGSFTRAVDLFKDTDDLKFIDFDFVTDLDVSETARLFGKEGAETIEPFLFANPPAARISGHVDGPASAKGKHRLVTMSVQSTGDFFLYHFPLKDLSFQGTIRDDEIDLPSIQVSFAQGQATGSANIAGPSEARRLRFDCKLNGALLGDVISTLEQYAAKERGEMPPEQSKFQKKVADGHLNLQLAAQGMYSDLYSFFGHGNLEVTGAQLAQVNLLGTLSQLLSKTAVFKFTTLELDAARTRFVLERDKLHLPDLKITGNTAAIEANGTYDLNKKFMEFDAKVYPFKQGKTLLANAVGLVLVPLSNALEVKLSGTVDKPNWRLAYGPTNFLYNITGTKPEDVQTEPSNKSKSRPLPTPYLRH